MATNADEVPKLALEVSCTGFATLFQALPREEITAYVVNFLTTHGIPAHPGSPKSTGATVGIPEAIKAVSWIVKAHGATAKFLADRARKLVRSELPLANIRFDSSVEAERDRWGLAAAFQAKDALAVLGELSMVLRRDFPLFNFEYTISAAKGNDGWVNVAVADEHVTYSMIHRLRRKVLSPATKQWTVLKIRNPWWFPWGLITLTTKPIDASQWDCRDPRLKGDD